MNRKLFNLTTRLVPAVERIEQHLGRDATLNNGTKLKFNGLRQHYVKLRKTEKDRKLIELLDKLEFNQVVIFVKSAQRCSALCTLLTEQKFPAFEIHCEMSHEELLAHYKEFKELLKPILIATNVFRVGMDIEGVNIVFNYDMPEDTDTYLHPVACADGFGAKGLAIIFVADKNDEAILNEVQKHFEIQITEMPDEIDVSTYIENR